MNSTPNARPAARRSRLRGRPRRGPRRRSQGDVARLQTERGQRDAALMQARADFAEELDKLREAAQRSEARLQAAEKRAWLEIERGRAIATQLKKDLDAAVRRAEHRDERHRAEAEGLRTQLGDVRHQVNVLQGRLGPPIPARSTVCGDGLQPSECRVRRDRRASGDRTEAPP